MTEPRITSTQNPRVKHLVRLRSRRHRDTEGLFTIEGYRELTRAIDSGIELEEVAYCPSLFLGANERALLEAAEVAGAHLIEFAEDPFRKVSYRDRPEGLIGLARQFPTGLDRLEPGPNPLVLVVESIEKPGNLGTMLRTADAAGADAVIVSDPATDPFNPNVVRASLGCLFLVPLAVASNTDTLAWLTACKIKTFAATPAGERLHWEADYRKPSALAIGSEQYGLSETWMTAADEQVRIPMLGDADSLNAAMAAGVMLYEAVRQRTTGRQPTADSR
ncbi:MAG: RNA methyltransferase [Gammaproteobacteria bacterium]|nr:RNA methyltransferase [Gammaproteobacteria bacterium]